MHFGIGDLGTSTLAGVNVTQMFLVYSCAYVCVCMCVFVFICTIFCNECCMNFEIGVLNTSAGVDVTEMFL